MFLTVNLCYSKCKRWTHLLTWLSLCQHQFQHSTRLWPLRLSSSTEPNFQSIQSGTFRMEHFEKVFINVWGWSHVWCDVTHEEVTYDLTIRFGRLVHFVITSMSPFFFLTRRLFGRSHGNGFLLVSNQLQIQIGKVSEGNNVLQLLAPNLKISPGDAPVLLMF